MNWGKRLLMMAALLGVFASGMVGCSKSSDSKTGTSGNVSMNGTGLTASDTVAGYPVSLNIQTSYGYGYPSQYPTTNSMLIVNGQQLNLQAMQVANYQAYGPSPITLGQYTGLGVTLCTDYSCMNTVTVLWVQPMLNGYNTGFNSAQPAMQVGFYKYADGSIHSSAERVGCAYSTMGTMCAGGQQLSTATDLMNWLISNAR